MTELQQHGLAPYDDVSVVDSGHRVRAARVIPPGRIPVPGGGVLKVQFAEFGERADTAYVQFADEGVTWCRGWVGVSVDALKAAAALTMPARTTTSDLLQHMKAAYTKLVEAQWNDFLNIGPH